MIKFGPQFQESLVEWVRPFGSGDHKELSAITSGYSAPAPTLYRGIRMPEGVSRDEFRKQVTAPEGYVMKPSDESVKGGAKGFSSWSEDKDVADTFSIEQSQRPGDSVVFVASGIRGLPVHEHLDPERFGDDEIEEKEWLVSHPATFRFKHTVRPNPQTQIFVGRKIDG
jgi:hypothetical protein